MAEDSIQDDEDVQTVESETSSWVEITSLPNEEEARLLAGFLENEGIPSQVEAVNSSELPVTFGKLGEIRLYVQQEQQEQAMSLLRSREAQYERLTGDESVITDDGPADIADDAVSEGQEP